MKRRSFLQMFVTGLGAAAVMHPLGDLVADGLRCAIPKSAKMVVPQDCCFVIKSVAFFNRNVEPIEPRLLVGSVEVESGLIIDQVPVHIDLMPYGGIVVPSGECIALMGKKLDVSMIGWKYFQALDAATLIGAKRIEFSDLIPYMYYLRV